MSKSHFVFFINFYSKTNSMNIQVVKPKLKFGAALKSKIQAFNQLNNKPENNLNKVKTHKFQRTKHSISQPKLLARNSYKQRNSAGDNQSSQLTRESSLLFKNVQFSFDNSAAEHNLSKNARSSILKRKNSLKQSSLKQSSINSYQIPIINKRQKLINNSQRIINQNKKYYELLNNLKRTKSLYTDHLFPPGSSTISLSLSSKGLFRDIRWVRIKQLFDSNRSIVIRQQRCFQQNIVVPGVFHQFKYMIDCFNSIIGNKKSLEIIFQDQQISLQGIYYLKLFHQGSWQYVLIDDYIPICKNTNRSAFIDVIPSETIEIWPFLLQKAFAKLYNCYEFLMPLENQQKYLKDYYSYFMHELTGNLPKQIDTNDQSLNLQLQNAFIDQDSTFLARKGNYWTSFVQSKNINNSNFVSKNDKVKMLKLENVQENGQQLVKISWVVCHIQTLQKEYDSIYICQVGKKFDYSISIPIRQSTNVAYSLRKFILPQSIQCSLSLIQKDKRNFRKLNYSYSWVRLIILMKEPSGVRWINGKYGKGKVLQLGNIWLQAGQYLCLITADWRAKPYDLFIHFQGSQELFFQRVDISTEPTIMKDLCADIAQRFGQNTQLNRCIYSYQYKDLANGFIIQNLHNESHRKYKFPKCQQKYQILSEQLTQDKQLEIFFSEYEERILIIKCKDGMNNVFFEQFQYDASK